MKSLLEKISSYNLLTNFIPGIFFFIGLKYLCGINIPTEDTVESLFVCYFSGFFISRIGSIVVEPLLRKIKFLQFSSYDDFVKASIIDPKVNVFSEQNNYLRSMVASMLMMPAAWSLRLLSLNWHWFSVNWKFFVGLILLIVLLKSYKKQTKYVVDRVNATTKTADTQEKALK